MAISNEEFTADKDKRKRLRVVMQIVIIFALIASSITAIFTLKAYNPYTPQGATVSGDKGFVALTYVGVGRISSQNEIGVERLHDQLKALKDVGYVTITQQDILNYYQSEAKLPEKSLFLAFEDGKIDTAMFTQKILEELNFKATMLTYPEMLEKKDVKLIMPEDMIELEKTTFWEMGIKGYQLTYDDYVAMQKTYTKSIGYVPRMYLLKRSSTGSFGNNDQVSANDSWIKDLFKINFSREGLAFNQPNSSIYDLTRIEPKAYWYTNHLLMRIKYDSNQDLEFVKGDVSRQKAWEILKGALEIQEESLILTSLPSGIGLIRLKSSNVISDIKLSVRMKGNKLGSQKIYLRSDGKLNRFLAVAIANNELSITERNGSAEKQLFKLNLDNDMPDLSVHTKGDRMLSLSLLGNKINIIVDNKEAVKDLQVSVVKAGAVFIETTWGGYGLSPQKMIDDVYDGVFEKLMITENTGVEKEKILFNSKMQGFAAAQFTVKHLWEELINWFIIKL